MYSQVELYGLFDPDSHELRYVGKATNSSERFKRHLCEANSENRPVNRWVRKLLKHGKVPILGILEVVPERDWKEAEIRLIALHRKTSSLLNLADGGDQPTQTPKQRLKAAEAANRAIAKQDHRLREFNAAKRNLAKFAAQLRKSGDLGRYWDLRSHMLTLALQKPHRFGCWLLH